MARENPVSPPASLPNPQAVRFLGIRPSFVTQESFLNFLNDPRCFVEIMKLQQADALAGREGYRVRVDIRIAAREGFAFLRELTDEWLGSGCRANGAEQPMRRNLEPCTGIKEAAAFYGSLVHSEKYLISTRAIDIQYEICDVGSMLDELIPQTKRIAVRLVVGMCNSDWRFKIAKCRSCGVYYRLPRNQAYYVRGTRHRKCFSKASAQEASNRSRRQEHRQKLELAIRAYVGLARKGKLPQRSSTAEHLHAVLQKRSDASRLPITKNWLSYNLELIESHGEAALSSVPGAELS